MPSSVNNLILERVRDGLSDLSLRSTDFRDELSLIATPKDVHRLLRFLRDDPDCNFNLLCDVTGVDYLDYPAQTLGRFAVVWILVNIETAARVRVKTFLDPSIPTSGIDEDEALYLDSSTDIWEGAEWREREIFDMFGIRFRNHPDLRRILMWKEYPAHPLRKDYPLRGRGERVNLAVVERDDA
jgi:NADH-quinone oxidoreductase subunit C